MNICTCRGAPEPRFESQITVAEFNKLLSKVPKTLKIQFAGAGRGWSFPCSLRLAYDRTCWYSSEAPMFDGLFQPMHLLVIFFIALLVFGPKKLPELGKGLGEGIRALKDGMKDNPPAQTTDQTKKTETKS
jgi:sec-independent protein translocase protein TatA